MIRGERVEYRACGLDLVGYLAYDDDAGVRPGLLLMHEGAGQDDNVRQRADRLAALGCTAFALDYFGGGRQLPLAETRARLGELFEKPALTLDLARAGHEQLIGSGRADRERIAAAGFCFGGVMALELARDDVSLRAAIGFHPGFAEPRVEDSSRITASVLMMCGADDPVVSAASRAGFEMEMRDANVADWRLEVYGGVGHAFTNPEVGGRGLPGFAYDARADRRSWASALDLLREVFGVPLAS